MTEEATMERLQRLEESVASLTGQLENERGARRSLEARLESLERPGSSVTAPLTAPKVEAPTTTSPEAPTTTSPEAPRPPAAAGPSQVRINPAAVTQVPKTSASAEGLFDRLKATPSEVWITRVGIGLLIIGAAFVFRYAENKGWLEERFRVFAGAGLSLGLSLLGLRVHQTRAFFASMLVGGGIVIAYMTTLASFWLYDLIPQQVALVMLSLVNGWGLYYAMTMAGGAMGALAIGGACSAPLMLSNGESSAMSLVGYTLLVTFLAAVLRMKRPWKMLELVGFLGILGLSIGITSDAAETSEKLLAQVVLLGWFIAYCCLPLLRLIVVDREGKESTEDLLGTATFIMLSAAITASITVENWSLDGGLNWPSIIVGIALLGGAVGWKADRGGLAGLAAAGASVAPLAVGLASPFTDLGGSSFLWLMGLSLGTQVWVMQAKARPLYYLSVLGGMAGTLLFLYGTSEGSRDDLPFLHVHGVACLAWLGMLLATALWRRDGRTSGSRWAALHAGFLLLTLVEFDRMDGGETLCTLVWTVLCVGLFVSSVRASSGGIQRAAFVTMALIVGKLILVDLAEIDALWRILVCITGGVVFLVLGYVLPRMTAKKPADSSS